MKRSRYPLQQSPLFRLRRKTSQAELLGISTKEVESFIDPSPWYSEWDQEKKNGKLRRIENPKRPLKMTQARMAKLLGRVEPSPNLHCPVKGRSYLTNAAIHRGSRVIRCLDIKNFFANSRESRVYRFFSKVLECAPDIAYRFTKIACYKGHLPTGSPLSPILAYYAYADIWQEIADLAERNGCNFTIYIDDLTFSGASVTDHLMWEIKKMIAKGRLEYHKEKMYIDVPAEVTGIILHTDGRMELPFRQHKSAHQARKSLSELASTNMGLEFEKTKLRLLGLESQARQVNCYN